MDRAAYWSLLDHTRALAGSESVGHEQTLRRALSERPPADLMDFERHATQLLTRACENRLRAAAHLINGGCTEDGFDAFRGWLVSQGRAVYEAALADPDSLADYAGLGNGKVGFEPLWRVAREEYLRLVGAEMPDLGPPTEDEDEDDPTVDLQDHETLHTLYPKLSARFG